MSSTMTARRSHARCPVLAHGGRRGRGHARRPTPTTGGSTTASSPTSTPSSSKPAAPTTSRSIRSCGWPPQWHTNDVLNNRALDGDIGSDGSTAQDRANARRVRGRGRRDGGDQPGAGDQRHRDHEPVVLPARLHGDHVQLRQHPDRRVVGEQPGPHASWSRSTASLAKAARAAHSPRKCRESPDSTGSGRH